MIVHNRGQLVGILVHAIKAVKADQLLVLPDNVPSNQSALPQRHICCLPE